MALRFRKCEFASRRSSVRSRLAPLHRKARICGPSGVKGSEMSVFFEGDFGLVGTARGYRLGL
jgi:hypothetical protein